MTRRILWPRTLPARSFTSLAQAASAHFGLPRPPRTLSNAYQNLSSPIKIFSEWDDGPPTNRRNSEPAPPPSAGPAPNQAMRGSRRTCTSTFPHSQVRGSVVEPPGPSSFVIAEVREAAVLESGGFLKSSMGCRYVIAPEYTHGLPYFHHHLKRTHWAATRSCRPGFTIYGDSPSPSGFIRASTAPASRCKAEP